jgi:hypothetical protein
LIGNQSYRVYDQTKDLSFEVSSNLNDREKETILSGGLLPAVKKRIQNI